MPKLKTTLEFINDAINKHGNVYGYEQVNYVNSQTKVSIYCDKHGYFQMKPNSHMNGQGCPICKNINNGIKKRLNKDEFIRRSNHIHNNKYDYSAIEYNKLSDKITIVCPNHGSFVQQASVHIIGHGCSKCRSDEMSKQRRLSNEDFIAKAREQHGHKYDYSLSEYIGSEQSVKILCPEHGEFSQTARSHLDGSNCPKCAGKYQPTTQEFINKVNIIHNNKYTYEHTNYINSNTKIKVTCNEHGIFEQLASNHSAGNGCPACALKQSKQELEIITLIKSFGLDIVARDRSIIPPFELDIVIPDKKIAIEYNGLFWHSDYFENAKYRHLIKQKLANDAGYRLIYIYEDDWIDRKQIVEKTLRHILNISTSHYYARKLSVRKMYTKDVRNFYNQNHLQGAGFGINYCLYDNNSVVAAMQFNVSSSERGNVDKSRYELVRFCSIGSVVGGASKLFNAFRKDHPDVKTIISYSDNDLFTGGMYSKLGFVKVHSTEPDYKCIVNKKRIHKSNFRRVRIKKNYPLVYNETLTEKQMCHDMGIYRIYNTGLTKWEWKQP